MHYARYCKEIADDLVGESKRLDAIHKQLTKELEIVKNGKKKVIALHPDVIL